MSKKKESLVITSDYVPKYNVSFYTKDKQVGELSWDDGVVEFKGDARESAERFFEFLKPYMDEYIKGKLNG